MGSEHQYKNDKKKTTLRNTAKTSPDSIKKTASTPFGNSYRPQIIDNRPRLMRRATIVDMLRPAQGKQAVQLTAVIADPPNQLKQNNLGHSRVGRIMPTPSLQSPANTPLIQRRLQATSVNADSQSTYQKGGLPAPLKLGLENLSGMSMDHVKVHYNSPKPAQLKAYAYTQGADIHVAPGQERHLPHEGWHVVQQAQGRVKPTMQMAGTHLNNDAGLEREADVMGAKSQFYNSNPSHKLTNLQRRRPIDTNSNNGEIIQRYIEIKAPENPIPEENGRDPIGKLRLPDGKFIPFDKNLWNRGMAYRATIYEQLFGYAEDDYGIELIESGFGRLDREELDSIVQRSKRGAIEKIAIASSYCKYINDPNIREKVEQVFKDDGALEQLVNNFDKMNRYLQQSNLFIAYHQGEDSSHNAYTLRGQITLKTRFFEKLTDTERVNTIIHEAVHAALGTRDYAYTTERLITFLDTQTALKNPDSYVWFMSSLLEDEPHPKGKVEDEFLTDRMTEDKGEIVKTIGLEVSTFVRIQELFEQSSREAEEARLTGAKYHQNIIYCIQEIKKTFSGTSQNWDPDVPSEAISKGLNIVSKTLTYLLGGLVNQVHISEGDILEPQWSRDGLGPVSLQMPRTSFGVNLYKTLLRKYVKDLLEPTKHDKWISYYNLIVNVSSTFIDLSNYIGTQMNVLETEK